MLHDIFLKAFLTSMFGLFVISVVAKDSDDWSLRAQTVAGLLACLDLLTIVVSVLGLIWFW